MPSFTEYECPDWGKNRMAAEEDERKQQEMLNEIQPNDKDYSEELAEKNRIEKLKNEGKIDPKQAENLEKIRGYIRKLCNKDPIKEKHLSKLEEKNIRHLESSIGQEIDRIEEELYPNNCAPDNNINIKKDISKLYQKTKDIISQIFSPKKEVIKNSDRT